MAIDDVVAEPVGQERRLGVVLDLADGLHEPVAVDLALDHLHRDSAVGLVADVAVMQRVEVRDVEEVLDQQQVVGRHLHGAGTDRIPGVVGDLGGARRARVVLALRVARPDPHQPVLLDHGERPEPRLPRDRSIRMRRDRHTVSVRFVAQAVVRTLQRAVVEHPSLGERHPLVRTPVVVRTDRPVARTPEEDRPAGNGVPVQARRPRTLLRVRRHTRHCGCSGGGSWGLPPRCHCFGKRAGGFVRRRREPLMFSSR